MSPQRTRNVKREDISGKDWIKYLISVWEDTFYKEIMALIQSYANITDDL